MMVYRAHVFGITGERQIYDQTFLKITNDGRPPPELGPNS